MKPMHAVLDEDTRTASNARDCLVTRTSVSEIKLPRLTCLLLRVFSGRSPRRPSLVTLCHDGFLRYLLWERPLGQTFGDVRIACRIWAKLGSRLSPEVGKTGWLRLAARCAVETGPGCESGWWFGLLQQLVLPCPALPCCAGGVGRQVPSPERSSLVPCQCPPRPAEATSHPLCPPTGHPCRAPDGAPHHTNTPLRSTHFGTRRLMWCGSRLLRSASSALR
jgi:hypothetical protein